MSKNEIKDRRTLLKGLVAGSAVVSGSKALPESWSKPLTNAVLLPSHAQTTGDFTYGDYNNGPGYGDGYSAGSGYSVDATDVEDNAAGDYTYGDTNGDDAVGQDDFDQDVDTGDPAT